MTLPPRPIHADLHWGNFVIVDGWPYLLDWDQIDLSDRSEISAFSCGASHLVASGRTFSSGLALT